MTPKLLTCLAVAALALTACSTQARPAPAAPPTPDVETIETAPAYEPIAPGRPAEWTQIYVDNTPGTTWAITLDKVACGVGEIPQATTNPAWDGSESVPEYVPAAPPPGKEYCRAYLTAKNIGKVPDATRSAGDLQVGDAYYAAVDNGFMAWTVMRTELGVEYAEQVNPGDSAPIMGIYEVPAGAAPTGVLYPTPVAGEQSTYLLRLA